MSEQAKVPAFLDADAQPDKSPEELAEIKRREIREMLKTAGWKHIEEFITASAESQLAAMRYAKSDFDSRTCFAKYVVLHDLVAVVNQLASEPQTVSAQ